MTIYYNTDDEPYNCFSNFSPHGFELDGRWWPTSEHYFQAQKFVGTNHVEVIQRAKTPLEAAQLGQDRARPLRSGWRQIKEAIMLKCVLHKFQVHDDIRMILLNTADRLIIEDWPHDYYWSNGADGSGKNRMGHILMNVRGILRMSLGENNGREVIHSARAGRGVIHRERAGREGMHRAHAGREGIAFAQYEYQR